MTPAVFLKAAFEICLLSLFVVCVLHSFLTHGWKRTVREFVAGFFMTAGCESIGVLSGAYVYPGFHWYVFATPVANPASWIATVYIIIGLTNRLVFGRQALAPGAAMGPLFRGSQLKTIGALAAIDSALALAVDLVMDPMATVYNWWVWVPCAPGVTRIGPGVVTPYNFDTLTFLTTPPNFFADFFARFFPDGMRYPTRLLGIPLINFIAWFVFVFVFAWEFRFVESRANWGELKKTLVLWLIVAIDIPILAMMLIAPNV
jgi:uncharacterized membrane protein